MFLCLWNGLWPRPLSRIWKKKFLHIWYVKLELGFVCIYIYLRLNSFGGIACLQMDVWIAYNGWLLKNGFSEIETSGRSGKMICHWYEMVCLFKCCPGSLSFIFEENHVKAGFGLMVWYWLCGCNLDREKAAGGSCSSGGGGGIFADQWCWCLEGEIWEWAREARAGVGAHRIARSGQTAFPIVMHLIGEIPVGASGFLIFNHLLLFLLLLDYLIGRFIGWKDERKERKTCCVYILSLLRFRNWWLLKLFWTKLLLESAIKGHLSWTSMILLLNFYQANDRYAWFC